MKKTRADQAAGEQNEEARLNDGRTQSERFIAKARELGLDEREETFDAALTKVARKKPIKGHSD